MSRVASALHGHLHNAAAGKYVPRARDRLRQEADRFDSLEDAALLRDYAEHAPAYVLVVPLDEYFGGGLVNQAANPIGHSASEQTVVRSDGHGHAVSQTRICHDGHCEVSNATMPVNYAGDSGLVNASDDVSPFHSLGHLRDQSGFQDGSLQHAVEQMTKDMKSMEKRFGHGTLEDSMKSIFKEAGKKTSKQTSAKSDATSESSQSFSHGSSSGSLGRSFDKSSNSESITSETQIKNGRRITKRRICKNGHCKTETIEEDADASDEDMNRDMAFEPLFADPLAEDSTGQQSNVVW